MKGGNNNYIAPNTQVKLPAIVHRFQQGRLVPNITTKKVAVNTTRSNVARPSLRGPTLGRAVLAPMPIRKNRKTRKHRRSN